VWFDGKVPTGTDPKLTPYVVVYFDSNDPEADFTAAPWLFEMTATCHSVGGSAQAARMVADRVRTALLGVRPTVANRLLPDHPRVRGAAAARRVHRAAGHGLSRRLRLDQRPRLSLTTSVCRPAGGFTLPIHPKGVRRMALITVGSVPGQTKVVISGAAVAASDTISTADIGTSGVLLTVINGGGSPINVTISDPGTTTVGNVGTTTAQAVANGTEGTFRILPGHVNTSTGVATVTYSGTTSVTYKAIKA
jgi:hypothetical protein